MNDAKEMLNVFRFFLIKKGIAGATTVSMDELIELEQELRKWVDE